MIHLSEGAGCHIVRIEGPLTIHEAKASKDLLLQALAQAEALEIHLAELSELDSAGLQLLLLAKREALHAGKSLRLLGHSEASLAVIELLGLASYFGDPLLLQAGGQRACA